MVVGHLWRESIVSTKNTFRSVLHSNLKYIVQWTETCFFVHLLYLQQLDVVLIAQCLHQPRVASLIAVLGQ